MDLGTGDGRLPWSWAQENADRLFVGIDANAAGLREFSGRALRVALANLVYVRAAVEDLPAELEGVADRLTVVLPWGSLLAAVARPSPEVLRGFRALCRLGARFTAVLAHDPVRDQAELVRLGLPPLDHEELRSRLAGYEEGGFALSSVRRLDRAGLAHWRTTWARRLSHGSARSFVQIDAAARARA